MSDLDQCFMDPGQYHAMYQDIYPQNGMTVLGKRQRTWTDEYNLFSDEIDTDLPLEKKNSEPLDVHYELTRKCQKVEDNQINFVYNTQKEKQYQQHKTMIDRAQPCMADLDTTGSDHHVPINYGKFEPVTNPIFKIEKVHRPKVDYSTQDLYLRMNSQTWMRDMFDLYDFQCNYHVKSKQGMNADEIDICLVDNEVTMKEKSFNEPASKHSLCTVQRDDQGYFIDKKDGAPDQFKKLWLPLRPLPNNRGETVQKSHRLKLHDIIRFGKTEYIVRDYNCPNNFEYKLDVHERELKRATLMVKNKNKSACQEEARCKICLESSDDAKNPLFNPCSCKGDLGLVHFNCLKRWLRENKETVSKNNSVNSFLWNKFKCEICTSAFPSTFKDSKRQLFKLLDITQLKKCKKENYLVLESLPLASDPGKDRHLILLKPNSSQYIYTVGRDSSNDIHIADRTISREQAIIRFENDGFYIQDQYSKFGTSIEIQDKTYICGPAATSKYVEVQAGRTMMTFSTIAVTSTECL